MSCLKESIAGTRHIDAIAAILRQLRARERVIRVAGPAGAAKPLTIAHALLAAGRSALVLTTTQAAAQELADELRFLTGLLSPGPPPVALLPSPEVDPYRGLSPHPETAAARARTLWQLLQDAPAICVASLHTAAMRLHPPGRFLSHCIELGKGEDCSLDELRSRLVTMGYVEDDPVTEAGEFSCRGGIVDVFPPHREHPVRLELFGDQVDSIRAFDPDSQRSCAVLDRVEIIPMREYCAGRALLERWAEEFPRQWSEPFHGFMEEELAMARQGELFAAFEFMLPAVDPLEATLFDYVRGYQLVVCEREAMESSLEKHHSELYSRFLDRIEAHKAVLSPEQIYLTVEPLRRALDGFERVEISELSIEQKGISASYVAGQPTRKYHGNIAQLVEDLRRFLQAGERVVMILPNLGRAERIRDILREYDIRCMLCRPDENGGDEEEAPHGVVLIGVGTLHRGCLLAAAGLRLVTGADIFDEVDVGSAPARARAAQRALFLSDFRDLKPGDYVVHVDHGIGQFHGLKQIGTQEGSKEFVLLGYMDDARLYVPVERLDLIQKYSSIGGSRPSLDRLGGVSWNRTKARIRKSMRDMANELLKLYAERKTVPGFPFSADSAWQQEFEDAFEYELTRDQQEAVASVKQDMELPRPMDRLICGDVGYGKTEVAMRAAFKAVMDGKQVALLAPTTVLAFQHFRTFRARFVTFPMRIELLSRFRTAKEQRQVVEQLETGAVDIVVGTHRLLSRDVKFKELGLVIVDEEQRFGVSHKERLKALKTKVDVLTLSATPIPRTLNMALVGLRDMSTIETPPKNRLAIQTSVIRYSPEVIRSSIELELARKGQVYFVHNRVETIYSVAAMVQQLVPRARIAVAHGQMSERELEKVMLRFVMDETDVLVTTTIIENGLDIPRVNTIIIDRADLYGMSQLYQLRGRVGRSDRRAYAYLLIPSEEVLSDVARKRLAAIREFSDLGTGFRVAALDLEIRGAGNLLGGEQHGHINAVGFDLYCKLLEQAVQEQQGLEPEQEVSTSINLNLDIRIPDDYIQEQGQRLRMYKRISSAQDAAELESLKQEMVDRFGGYPEQVECLFRYARLRQTALQLKIQSIERNREQIFIRLLDQSGVSAEKLLRLVTRNRRASFSPQGVLALEVEDLPPAGLFDALGSILDDIRAD